MPDTVLNALQTLAHWVQLQPSGAGAIIIPMLEEESQSPEFKKLTWTKKSDNWNIWTTWKSMGL